MKEKQGRGLGVKIAVEKEREMAAANKNMEGKEAFGNKEVNHPLLMQDTRKYRKSQDVFLLVEKMPQIV